MTEHELKCWPEFFKEIVSRNKYHDLRKNDRPFQIGDILRLMEYDPVTETYTGRQHRVEITYMTSGEYPCALSEYGLDPQYCILSIRSIEQHVLGACLEILTHLEEKIPVRFAETKDPYASANNLRWMIEHIRTNSQSLPLDKINRWIGYIQGVLAAEGILDVAEERNRTRPIYHRAYDKAGIEIPETAERPIEE